VVEHGIAFSKEVGAKVTAVTVTEPFSALALAPNQLEYTRNECDSHAKAYAEQALAAVAGAAKLAGVTCDTVHAERSSTPPP
jgi:nucleotide-binding universal stress UspA family protein